MCWGMTLCGRNGGNKIEQKIYGYIRVSTREQNEDRQVIALREVGVPEKNVYIDKQSGKDFERPQYKKLLRRMKKKTICSISRASIVWDAITQKYWSNGAFSQRKKALTLWFWICRFWIHGEVRIYWELSSVTLCCKYCLLWQRTSAPTSVSGRLRESQRQSQGHSVWAATQTAAQEFPFRLPALENGRNHRDGSSKGMWDAPCHLPLPGRDLRKSQVVVKGVFLQECVPFCKENITSFYFAVLCGFSSN